MKLQAVKFGFRQAGVGQLACWHGGLRPAFVSEMGSEAILLADKIPEFLEAVVLVNTLTQHFTQELVNTSSGCDGSASQTLQWLNGKNEDRARSLIYKVWLNIMCCYVLGKVICHLFIFKLYVSTKRILFFKVFCIFSKFWQPVPASTIKLDCLIWQTILHE